MADRGRHEAIIERYLRQRGIHDMPPGLAEEVLRAAQATPQEARGRFWPPMPRLALASAAAAVVVAAAVIALQLFAPAVGDDPAPTVTPTPTPGVSPTDSGSPSPTPFGAGVFENPDSCVNEDLGYRVAFPESWHHNTADGETAECTYLHPEEFELTDDAPPETAISFESTEGLVIGTIAIYTIVDQEETTVDGRAAVRWEMRGSEAGGGNLGPDDYLYHYTFLITDDDGPTAPAINVTLSSLNHPDYEDNKAILDQMMETIEIEDTAQDDMCTDPESDFGDMPFLCGQIGVNLETDAEATIEEVLARSAPEAEVIHQAEGHESYMVAVPVGDEWANVQALREDPDVNLASLVASGETTVPDDG